MVLCLSRWWNCAKNKARKFSGQLLRFFSSRKRQQGDERTGSNAGLNQDAGVSDTGEPHEPNSARGNRDRKLREAIPKSFIVANTAGGLANVTRKLVTKLEKKDGNMNPFTTLKEAIDPEENRVSPIIGKERTGRNASLIQHDRMPINPASGAAGRNGKPLKPNSGRGNRDKKLRKAVQTSASLTSTSGQFADTCKQLAAEKEKKNEDTNTSAALKKVFKSSKKDLGRQLSAL